MEIYVLQLHQNSFRVTRMEVLRRGGGMHVTYTLRYGLTNYPDLHSSNGHHDQALYPPLLSPRVPLAPQLASETLCPDRTIRAYLRWLRGLAEEASGGTSGGRVRGTLTTLKYWAVINYTNKTIRYRDGRGFSLTAPFFLILS